MSLRVFWWYFVIGWAVDCCKKMTVPLVAIKQSAWGFFWISNLQLIDNCSSGRILSVMISRCGIKLNHKDCHGSVIWCHWQHQMFFMTTTSGAASDEKLTQWWPLYLSDPKIMSMMTSSNGNIFRVTGPLCGEFTGPGEFPTQRPVTRSFDVFFDLHPNKRLSKQPRSWWFETLSCPLWRHRNGIAHKWRCN